MVAFVVFVRTVTLHVEMVWWHTPGNVDLCHEALLYDDDVELHENLSRLELVELTVTSC